ncbi:hypothetical protein [Paenarthrobacter sp. FR1]|uniref:hypothetical protein n=1 Tax=Paenarthrobacter sp. FR1 TaxID=3439548 RepID=UPI003DA33E21
MLATTVTLLAMRRGGRPRARHVKSLPARKHRSAPAGTYAVVVVLCGFTALLSWWIGIVALFVSGAGVQAFLAFLVVPVVTTAGTILAARRAGWTGGDVVRTVGLRNPRSTR